MYYYELTVLDQGLYGKIAIGFADKSFKLTRQPGCVGALFSVPGKSNPSWPNGGSPTHIFDVGRRWEVGSYGYHGDDGKKFTGSALHGDDYGGHN